MKKVLLLFMMLAVSVGLAQAQKRTVSGVVTDAETGSPLPLANVQIKGATTGTVTDNDGRFTLQVPGEEAILVFFYTGYQTQEIPVAGQTTFNVALKSANEEIDQVVVLGYGTRGKNEITGSTVQVGGEQIAAVPVVSPVEALQGKVPGLMTNMSSSTPGSGQQVRIRGVGSLTASSTPLYVIDGVPVNSGNYTTSDAESTLSLMATLNPNDIESMTLLKDASATAAYGARGSNGVIVITTKKGKKGRTQFNFSGYYGFAQRATDGIKMMTAQQTLEMLGKARRNSEFLGQLKLNKPLYNEYKTGTLSDNSMAKVNEIWAGLPAASEYEKKFIEGVVKEWDAKGRPEYDWQKEMDRRFAHTFNGVLSAQGGDENYSYYASLGVNYSQSVVKGSDYKRTTGALNFSRRLVRWLDFSTVNKVSFIRQDGVMAEQAAYYSNPMVAKYFVRPFYAPYNEAGEPNAENLGGVYNWLKLKDLDIRLQDVLRGTTTNSLTATIIEGLKFKTLVSLDYSLFSSKMFQNREYGDGKNEGGNAYRQRANDFNLVFQNSLSYDFSVAEDHHFSLTALMEYQKNNYDLLEGAGNGTISNKLANLSSMAQGFTVGESQTNWMNAAYLFMLNYNYLGRYVLDATYRYEGSSRFPKANRFGHFGSVGVAWNMHLEPFFEPARGVMNTLKLRASWGVSGNSEIDINSYQRLMGTSSAYNERTAGAFQSIGNPDLTWEKNWTFDAGVDFGFWDDRISGTLSYYDKRTYDLLQNVPLSRTTMFSTMLKNVGKMDNRGFEGLLNFDIVRMERYHLSVGLNAATIRNRVKELAKDNEGKALVIESNTTKTDEGHKLNEWYLRQAAGISPQTGLPLWYVDESRTEVTTDYNKAKPVWTGYSGVPTWTGGVSLHFDAWGAYLDMNLYVAGGHKVMNNWQGLLYDENARSLLRYHAPAALLDSWEKPGDEGKEFAMMAIGIRNQGASQYGQDRYLYKGDYLRLKDLTIGYTFPSDLLKGVQLGVYLRGTNLLTYAFDKRLEFDPEVRLDGWWNFYNPPSRVFTFGLNMNF